MEQVSEFFSQALCFFISFREIFMEVPELQRPGTWMRHGSYRIPLAVHGNMEKST